MIETRKYSCSGSRYGRGVAAGPADVEMRAMTLRGWFSIAAALALVIIVPKIAYDLWGWPVLIFCFPFGMLCGKLVRYR